MTIETILMWVFIAEVFLVLSVYRIGRKLAEKLDEVVKELRKNDN